MFMGGAYPYSGANYHFPTFLKNIKKAKHFSLLCQSIISLEKEVLHHWHLFAYFAEKRTLKTFKTQFKNNEI
jgi:hypothetical protein